MNLPRYRGRHRMSLTSMVDVVFLLLIFFMLAARFGAEGAIRIAASAGSAEYSGAPRLVDILPDAVRLNGVTVDEGSLAASLTNLTEGPDDLIILRPVGDVDVQRLVTVMDRLQGSGLTRLAIVE